MIKQFDNIAHETDERRLKLEQMRLNIDKTKAEVEKMELGDVAPVYIVDDIGDDDD